jgi:hypothetical protein
MSTISAAPESDHRRGLRPAQAAAWAVLLTLLALLLVAAVTADRSGWPSLVGDEATYLMQAESVAWDFDLRYTRGDHDRFVALHGTPPEGLILQSGDRGRHISYGKPFFYALYTAPFTRLAPVHGPLVANALLLALAAVLAARALRRTMGASAPLWTAFAIFGSVAFAYVFWVHSDLFLTSLTAIALALLVDGERRGAGRWILAGALLAVVAYSRPMYGFLFLPAILAVPRDRWRRFLPLLVAGALAVVLAAAAVHQSLTGSWTSYGASRRGFYSYTGFPGVDFPAAAWHENLEEWGDHAWLRPSHLGRKKIVASLWGWNVLYYLAGRHVGLLAYFLPALLAFAGRPRGAFRWGLVAAVALGVAAFLWLRPFNFWGGGGAIANRYFLPLFAACWFLPSRPLRAWWIAVAAAVAALFLHPLWLRPAAFPLWDGDGYRYVSPLARALPYETTQSHLKPSGQEDVRHHGLWIKFLDRGVGAVRDGELLRLRDGGGVLLVGSEEPLAVLELELRDGGDAELVVEGGEVRDLPSPGRWRKYSIVLDGPRARHPMWWTWEPFYLYRLRLTLVGASGPMAARLRTAS